MDDRMIVSLRSVRFLMVIPEIVRCCDSFVKVRLWICASYA